MSARDEQSKSTSAGAERTVPRTTLLSGPRGAVLKIALHTNMKTLCWSKEKFCEESKVDDLILTLLSCRILHDPDVR